MYHCKTEAVIKAPDEHRRISENHVKLKTGVMAVENSAFSSQEYISFENILQ